MNASADVLAVMDRCIEILHSNAWGEDREDLQEARAAVAELIASDKEYDEAHAEFYAVAMYRETANERYMRQGRYITARKRRAAALARVQGEGQ